MIAAMVPVSGVPIGLPGRRGQNLGGYAAKTLFARCMIYFFWLAFYPSSPFYPLFSYASWPATSLATGSSFERVQSS
jgi:hypothetical protein